MLAFGNLMRAETYGMACKRYICKDSSRGSFLCCRFKMPYRNQVTPVFDNQTFLKLCEREPKMAWKSCDQELMSKCRNASLRGASDANDSGNLSSNGSFDAHQSKNYSIVVLVYLIALLGGFLALS